jgi:hypothetical protein
VIFWLHTKLLSLRILKWWLLHSSPPDFCMCFIHSFFCIEDLFQHSFIFWWNCEWFDTNHSVSFVLFGFVLFFDSLDFHFAWMWYFRKNEALEIRGAETFCECSVDKNGRNFKFVKNVMDLCKMWVRTFLNSLSCRHIKELKSYFSYIRESRQRKRCFVFADPLRELDRRLQLKRYNIAREFNRLYAALQFDARDKHYIVVSGTQFLSSLILFCFVVFCTFYLNFLNVRRWLGLWSTEWRWSTSQVSATSSRHFLNKPQRQTIEFLCDNGFDVSSRLSNNIFNETESRQTQE